MQQTIIKPQRNPFKIDVKELYQYRELLWTLTYRDIRIKYAQTALGLAWAILNPMLTVAILSFIFGVIAKVDTGDVPHLIYTLAGMCGWTYFQAVMTSAGDSIIGAQNMVKKIYFPRLVIPLSKALTAFIDLLVILICMGILMGIYRFPPSPTIIYLPFFILIAIIAGLAGGIWMSALTIRYRDFKHITPMILRLGMYATPIAFPASLVPDRYLLIYYLNPMAGVVEGVRWSIIGGNPPNDFAYISFALITIFLIFGIFYFNKIEKIMADIL